MRQFPMFLGFTLVSCVLQGHCVALPALPVDRAAAVDQVIRTAMSEAGVPGMSVAVVTGDGPPYLKGFGVADLEGSVSANAESVYRLGSLTKTITAVAVMQLAERGKLDLDAPIQRYCAAYSQKQWLLHARELLDHQGGVRDYSRERFFEEYFSTRHYNSVTESLAIFKDDPLQQEPGTKYSYSTYGYDVLGCAIEGASGESYETYIRANIFEPAGMKYTAVDDVSRLIVNRVRGYGKSNSGVTVNTQLADTSNKIPAGGLVSTVGDVARFIAALESGVLLKPATREHMWTLQSTLDGKKTVYALGWRVADRADGLREIFHGGAAAGFSTFLYLIPEKKITVVLMANLELLASKQRDDLARKIAEIALH